jgi:dipeptidase
MCDTFVALGSATADGSVIFGKNSDRDPNEAHEVVILPRADHPEDSQVQCTYISVPQVAHTHAVMLAKPFWIWGAEMGANEHGVVIGNEAVFTRAGYQKEPGLIGMDFLRLALERAATAREALDVMIALLEQYGQGGNCGFQHPLHYHNSFIIADAGSAWVFETAGKQWAAQQVRDVRSISNALTIENDWDLASDGLVDLAVARGWCKDRAGFSFARCYSDPFMTTFAAGKPRQCRTTDLLRASKGKVDVALAMRVLRDHGADDRSFSPASGLTGCNVCAHAGYGPVRISQSTGSLVSTITPGGQATHWVTATSAPCTSTFKPVWIDAGMPATGAAPEGVYAEDSLWWRHELLHREVLKNYAARMAVYRNERDGLEAGFRARSAGLAKQSGEERQAFSCECFQQADAAERGWLERVRRVPAGSGSLHARAWRGFDRLAKIPAGK